MRWITGLSARGRVALAGAAAGAVALVAAAALAAPGGGDEAQPPDTGRTEVAVAPAAVPAPTTTTLRPTTTSPTTAPTTTTQAQPQQAVAADTGAGLSEQDEYDEHGEYDEYPEGICGCGDGGYVDDGAMPVDPLPDGRHPVLVVGVDSVAGMVELIVVGDTDNVRHLMYVTTGYDLTGLIEKKDALPAWATVEGGIVTLLEPIPFVA